MVIGVLKIELYMNGNRSLKEKRQVLRSLIQRIKSHFSNVSISEVDSQNLWKRATIGVSFVSNETPHVNSTLDQVLKFIDSSGIVLIGAREMEIFHF